MFPKNRNIISATANDKLKNSCHIDNSVNFSSCVKTGLPSAEISYFSPTSNDSKWKGISRSTRRIKQVNLHCQRGKSKLEPKNPLSSAITDATLKEYYEKSLIQLPKDISCNWHLYPNYIKNKADYLTAKEKYNTSAFESCNQFREDCGFQIAQEGEFEMLKETSKILKHEKLETVVRKITNSCNKKQHLTQRLKRSYPPDKKPLVNFKKTSKKPKELENIFKKPQAKLEKKQQFIVSTFCPKNCDKRSSNNNNIKHRPPTGYSHKNCGILSEKLYENISKNINKISDPTLYRSRDVKGKQPNKFKDYPTLCYLIKLTAF